MDPRYWPRALSATVGSAATSTLSLFEPEYELTPVQDEVWSRTIFVIGLPRSGTTHLHYLLSKNPQLAYPPRLDCYNPHTFLRLHRLGITKLLSLVPEKDRQIDRVQTGWLTPEEETLAICVLTSQGASLASVFPSRSEHYYAQGPFAPNTQEADRWRMALKKFSQKLVKLYNKPVLLKSPENFLQIPEILRVLPLLIPRPEADHPE